jgi:putative ABC transport system permease protein
MGMFVRDFRYGLRLMALAPGLSVIAVLALALGIGANTAIFSVVNTVLLQGLPVHQPERLVSFMHHSQQRKIDSPGTPYPDVVEWRRQFTMFEAIAAKQDATGNLSQGDEPERVLLGRVNAGFFPMLRVRPILGRDFQPEEDKPGAGRVAILGYELWKRRFGSDPGVTGTSLTLDGEPYQIVGVLPKGFRWVGPRNDLYVPLALSEQRGKSMAVTAYGRMKPGITRAQLEPELEAVTAATAARVPAYKGWQLRVGEVREWIVPDVRTSLWVLLGAVGLVLLIACANVASLLLSRAAVRRRELAVRTALGAGRGRLIAQLMAECLPIGLLGGFFGFLLAFWSVRLLRQVELSRIARLSETSVDGTVLAFTFFVSLLTCVLFGFAPALAASRTDLQEALKESGRGASPGLHGARLRSALVISEVALALLLSIGATLMIRTFQTLSAANPGFRPDHLLAAFVELPRAKYNTKDKIFQFYGQAVERLSAMPGVKSVAMTSSLPLGGAYFKGDFLVEGRDYANRSEIPVLNLRNVDSNYFRTLEIPMRRGRYFDDRDKGGPPVVIINETTARRLFGKDDPIGKRIGNPSEWMTIVGIAADVKHTDVAMEMDSEVLLPFQQKPACSMTLMVRLDPTVYSEPMRLAPALRRAIGELDRTQAAARINSVERIMADRLTTRRLNMIVLSVFAGLAILLAAVGIYGVLSFTVARRTHEIGVRMALGAHARDVTRLVVRQALTLALIGIGMGFAGSVAFTRLMTSLLYGVRTIDPFNYAGAALILLGVAAVAAWVPARRAARVDPLVALRCE